MKLNNDILTIIFVGIAFSTGANSGQAIVSINGTACNFNTIADCGCPTQ